MKKVAIVTIFGGANYGNKLQMYAVQQTLRGLGCASEVLWRDPEQKSAQTPRAKKNLAARLTPGNIRQVLHSRLHYLFDAKNGCDGKNATVLNHFIHKKELLAAKSQRLAAFNAFDNKFIEMIDFFVSSNNLPVQKLSKYDCFLCGSDQAWNPTYPITMMIDFLAFALEEKRVVYAPSFGLVQIQTERSKEYAEWLATIPHFSVREQQAVEIIRQVICRQEELLNDHTTMLSAAEWLAIARPPAIEIPVRYLLAYFLGDETSEYGRFIASLAKKHGLAVINLHNLRYLQYYAIDLCGFLWLIANAELICTDSLHSTVLSILFKLDFIPFERVESGGSMGSRQTTLLQLFQLENRAFGEVKESNNIIAVDFSNVPAVLQRERIRANNYLSSALEMPIYIN